MASETTSPSGRSRSSVRAIRFARAGGYDIVQEFREEGISGASDLDARPALMEALTAIASNGVRVIIVEHADRIARDLLVQESLIRQFQAIGARLLTADGVDLTDDAEPSRVLVRQMLGAIAQHDKQRLVLKLRASRHAARKTEATAKGGRHTAGATANARSSNACGRSGANR